MTRRQMVLRTAPAVAVVAGGGAVVAAAGVRHHSVDSEATEFGTVTGAQANTVSYVRDSTSADAEISFVGAAQEFEKGDRIVLNLRDGEVNSVDPYCDWREGTVTSHAGRNLSVGGTDYRVDVASLVRLHDDSGGPASVVPALNHSLDAGSKVYLLSRRNATVRETRVAAIFVGD